MTEHQWCCALVAPEARNMIEDQFKRTLPQALARLVSDSHLLFRYAGVVAEKTQRQVQAFDGQRSGLQSVGRAKLQRELVNACRRGRIRPQRKEQAFRGSGGRHS